MRNVCASGTFVNVGWNGEESNEKGKEGTCDKPIHPTVHLVLVDGCVRVGVPSKQTYTN